MVDVRNSLLVSESLVVVVGLAMVDLFRPSSLEFNNSSGIHCTCFKHILYEMRSLHIQSILLMVDFCNSFVISDILAVAVASAMGDLMRVPSQI